MDVEEEKETLQSLLDPSLKFRNFISLTRTSFKGLTGGRYALLYMFTQSIFLPPTPSHFFLHMRTIFCPLCPYC